jgi:hypothetical protein
VKHQDARLSGRSNEVAVSKSSLIALEQECMDLRLVGEVARMWDVAYGIGKLDEEVGLLRALRTEMSQVEA